MRRFRKISPHCWRTARILNHFQELAAATPLGTAFAPPQLPAEMRHQLPGAWQLCCETAGFQDFYRSPHHQNMIEDKPIRSQDDTTFLAPWFPSRAAASVSVLAAASRSRGRQSSVRSGGQPFDSAGSRYFESANPEGFGMARKRAAKKPIRHVSGQRELIDTGNQKRYVRRTKSEQFHKIDDVGRSLSLDRSAGLMQRSKLVMAIAAIVKHRLNAQIRLPQTHQFARVALRHRLQPLATTCVR